VRKKVWFGLGDREREREEKHLYLVKFNVDTTFALVQRLKSFYVVPLLLAASKPPSLRCDLLLCEMDQARQAL
jgi:hypothetical protein